VEHEQARWIVPLAAVLGGVLIGLLRKPPTLLVLAVNLAPVAGVLWLGWSPLQLLLLYWLENVVVGVFNWAKLKDYETQRPEPAGAPFAASNFFAGHYGAFTAAHGLFAVVVGVLFAQNSTDPDAQSAWTAADGWSLLATFFGLAAVHLGDYLHWRGREGWKEASIDAQMYAPYGRIIVMHLTIIGGAFILAATHAPVAYVALLAVFKTFIETGWAAMGSRRLAGGAMTLTIDGKTWRSPE
jgi:hypothetical protein